MISTAQLFNRYYFSRSDFADGTTEFHDLVSNYRRQGASTLEIGAGPSNPTSDYLRTLGTVDGVDVAADVLDNRALRAGYVFDGRKLPFDDASYDLCVSNYVLEHVADPTAHFTEVARILKPDGAYVFRTPNSLHYVAIAARLLPDWIHQRLSPKLRATDTETYPTFYRANSPTQLRVLSMKANMTLSIRMVEKEPSYGRVSPVLFYPMMAYERIVNSFSSVSCLRANIFGVAVRRDASEQLAKQISRTPPDPCASY